MFTLLQFELYLGIYVIKVSFRIQTDNSFPRIIDWKIHFRYFGVYILGSLSPPEKILF